MFFWGASSVGILERMSGVWELGSARFLVCRVYINSR